eukprot:TRINITY_DN31018_c0_g1_i1.p1 TRINITY_DN31018_c0_g1~~TRINITY_DN31018_c0_g1_i1.p1  ORF type:complete len:267 (+),score=120.27 TRINITY_DN31018_c0_g1_i1:187-987(+)
MLRDVVIGTSIGGAGAYLVYKLAQFQKVNAMLVEMVEQRDDEAEELKKDLQGQQQRADHLSTLLADMEATVAQAREGEARMAEEMEIEKNWANKMRDEAQQMGSRLHAAEEELVSERTKAAELDKRLEEEGHAKAALAKELDAAKAESQKAADKLKADVQARAALEAELKAQMDAKDMLAQLLAKERDAKKSLTEDLECQRELLTELETALGSAKASATEAQVVGEVAKLEKVAAKLSSEQEAKEKLVRLKQQRRLQTGNSYSNVE